MNWQQARNFFGHFMLLDLKLLGITISEQMSTPERETIEEQVQGCLKTVQKALGIEKARRA